MKHFLKPYVYGFKKYFMYVYLGHISQSFTQIYQRKLSINARK